LPTSLGDRNILIAKNVGRRVAEIVLVLKTDVIVLEGVKKMIGHVGDLKKDYRLRLYLNNEI